MEAVFRIAVQWLHVTAGVLWIGGGFYTILVQLPALLASPPAARGAIMPNLVPRQFTYIFRVAEFTILTGLLNLFASGRAGAHAARHAVVLGDPRRDPPRGRGVRAGRARRSRGGRIASSR